MLRFIFNRESQALPWRASCHLLATLALVLLSGCNPAPKDPVRIAIHPFPGYETLHLALSLGYIDTALVRPVEMVNASQAAQALRNHTVDAAMMTLDEALSLMQDGVDLRVVLVMDLSNGADVVMARPEIANLQALRGKRVAVENGAVGAVMLDATLEEAGLKPADVQLLATTFNDHASVYLNGKADAVVTFEPVRSELLKQGAKILFDSSRIPGRIVDVLAVRTGAILEHRDALKQVVASHFKAMDYLAVKPQDAARRLAPFMGVKEAEVTAQFDGLKLPTLAENRALLSGVTADLNTRAASLAGLMLRRKLLQRAVNTEHLADPMFLPQEK